MGASSVCGVVSAAVLSGCQLKSSGTNLVNGKKLFVEQCGACHTLARAGATGATGPNLDEAFRSRARTAWARARSGRRPGQILHPEPSTLRSTLRPSKTLPLDAGRTSSRARTRATSRPTSPRRVAVQRQGHRPARRRRRREGRGHRQGARTARSTSRSPPPASPTSSPTRRANAGQVTIKSENPQTTGHDIAIEGNGVDQKGEVVTNGGTSQFTADLKPGDYTFFCSVPGHREGGMEGKLTVK